MLTRPTNDDDCISHPVDRVMQHLSIWNRSSVSLVYQSLNWLVIHNYTAKNYHIWVISEKILTWVSSDVIAVSLLFSNRLKHACLSISDTGITVFISVSDASYMLTQLCCPKFMIQVWIRPESGVFQPELACRHSTGLIQTSILGCVVEWPVVESTPRWLINLVACKFVEFCAKMFSQEQLYEGCYITVSTQTPIIINNYL